MSLDTIRHINPATILDVGAHCGHWAIEAHGLWPAAAITCIEGNPACEPALKATGFPYKIAMVGGTFKKLPYYKQPGTPFGTGNSLYRELTPFFAQCDVDEVDVVPLASLFPIGETFDFVKLDLQGAEMEVIVGGLEICKAAKHILMEVAYVEYNRGAPMADVMFRFMERMGFTVRQFVQDICHPLNRNILVQRDVLFSR